MQINKNIHIAEHLSVKISLKKLMGYVILYCGSLVLTAKIFIAIL